MDQCSSLHPHHLHNDIGTDHPHPHLQAHDLSIPVYEVVPFLDKHELQAVYRLECSTQGCELLRTILRCKSVHKLTRELLVSRGLGRPTEVISALRKTGLPVHLGSEIRLAGRASADVLNTQRIVHTWRTLRTSVSSLRLSHFKQTEMLHLDLSSLPLPPMTQGDDEPEAHLEAGVSAAPRVHVGLEDATGPKAAGSNISSRSHFASACVGRFIKVKGKEFNKDAEEPDRVWEGRVHMSYPNGYVTTYYPEDRQHDYRPAIFAAEHMVSWSDMSHEQLSLACRSPPASRAAALEEFRARGGSHGKGTGKASLSSKLFSLLHPVPSATDASASQIDWTSFFGDSSSVWTPLVSGVLCESISVAAQAVLLRDAALSEGVASVFIVSANFCEADTMLHPSGGATDTPLIWVNARSYRLLKCSSEQSCYVLRPQPAELSGDSCARRTWKPKMEIAFATQQHDGGITYHATKFHGHGKAYAFQCDACHRKSKICVHLLLLRILAATPASTSGLHVLLVDCLQHALNSLDLLNSSTAGLVDRPEEESAPVHLFGEGWGSTDTFLRMKMQKEWDSNIRLLQGACQRFVRYPVQDEACDVVEALRQHCQKSDAQEASFAAALFNTGSLKSYILPEPPNITKHRMNPKAHNAHTIQPSTSLCASQARSYAQAHQNAQLVCIPREHLGCSIPGRFHPYVPSWLPAYCDLPLYYTAAVELACSRRGWLGAVLNSVFESLRLGTTLTTLEPTSPPSPPFVGVVHDCLCAMRSNVRPERMFDSIVCPSVDCKDILQSIGLLPSNGKLHPDLCKSLTQLDPVFCFGMWLLEPPMPLIILAQALVECIVRSYGLNPYRTLTKLRQSLNCDVFSPSSASICSYQAVVDSIHARLRQGRELVRSHSTTCLVASHTQSERQEAGYAGRNLPHRGDYICAVLLADLSSSWPPAIATRMLDSQPAFPIGGTLILCCRDSVNTLQFVPADGAMSVLEIQAGVAHIYSAGPVLLVGSLGFGLCGGLMFELQGSSGTADRNFADQVINRMPLSVRLPDSECGTVALTSLVHRLEMAHYILGDHVPEDFFVAEAFHAASWAGNRADESFLQFRNVLVGNWPAVPWPEQYAQPADRLPWRRTDGKQVGLLVVRPSAISWVPMSSGGLSSELHVSFRKAWSVPQVGNVLTNVQDMPGQSSRILISWAQFTAASALPRSHSSLELLIPSTIACQELTERLAAFAASALCGRSILRSSDETHPLSEGERNAVDCVQSLICRLPSHFHPSFLHLLSVSLGSRGRSVLLENAPTILARHREGGAELSSIAEKSCSATVGTSSLGALQLSAINSGVAEASLCSLERELHACHLRHYHSCRLTPAGAPGLFKTVSAPGGEEGKEEGDKTPVPVGVNKQGGEEGGEEGGEGATAMALDKEEDGEEGAKAGGEEGVEEGREEGREEGGGEAAAAMAKEQGGEEGGEEAVVLGYATCFHCPFSRCVNPRCHNRPLCHLTFRRLTIVGIGFIKGAYEELMYCSQCLGEFGAWDVHANGGVHVFAQVGLTQSFVHANLPKVLKGAKLANVAKDGLRDAMVAIVGNLRFLRVCCFLPTASTPPPPTPITTITTTISTSPPSPLHHLLLPTFTTSPPPPPLPWCVHLLRSSSVLGGSSLYVQQFAKP